MLLDIFLMQVFDKGDKVVLMALFPYLFWAKKCFTIKLEIKDSGIDINGIIWGLILALYLGSPDFMWNFNCKYGAAGFCY